MSYLLRFEFYAEGAFDIPTFVILDEEEHRLFQQHNLADKVFTHRVNCCDGSYVSHDSNNCYFVAAQAIPPLDAAAHALLSNSALHKQIRAHLRRAEALFVLVSYRRRCDSEVPFTRQRCTVPDSDVASVPLTREDFELFLQEKEWRCEAISGPPCPHHHVPTNYYYNGFTCVLPHKVRDKEFSRLRMVESHFMNEFGLTPVSKHRVKKMRSRAM